MLGHADVEEVGLDALLLGGVLASEVLQIAPHLVDIDDHEGELVDVKAALRREPMQVKLSKSSMTFMPIPVIWKDFAVTLSITSEIL